MKKSFAIASLITLAALGSAQSRSGLVLAAAGNADQTDSQLAYGADFSGDGSKTTLSTTKDWSGQDSFGNAQTMTFTQTAMAEQNFLKSRVSVDATLTNVFYSPANAPYYTGSGNPNDEGVPDTISAIASARYSDKLAFGGGAFTGYKSVYRFHIEGSFTGTNVGATLKTIIAGNKEFIDFDETDGIVDQF